MAKMYATRKELVDAVRRQNPQLQNISEQEVYDQFIKKYPEYQSRVQENLRENMDLQIEDQRSIEADPDRKTAFTAVAQFFSRDFYKYIPYVRDAELFEMGDLYAASKRLQDGTASPEDVNQLKGWIAEENRPQSWGYKTINLLQHIPAYAIEFATVIGGVKTLGKVAGVTAAKAGMKKVIKEGIEETVEAGVKKGLKAKIGSFVSESVEQAARNNFQNMLSESAKKAAHRELKLSLKGTLKGAAQGMREAAVRNVFRSPQAAIVAVEKMIPQMRLSEGLDNELAIEILDEGDNLIPALVKAYGDQQIEFFTESVGDSLRLMHNLWGKHVLSRIAATEIGETWVGRGAKVAAKYDDIVSGPIKAAIAKSFLKLKQPEDLKKILRTGGWNGVIEEMYEERVGDVLRASTGLQENWFPSPDQLASEAVAFALFGAGSTAAYTASHSKVLGGAGIQEYLEKIGEIQPEGEQAIRTKKETSTIVQKIAEEYRQEMDNPNPLIRVMRAAASKINDLTGLDLDPQMRGGINDLMMRVTGSTLTAHIAQAVEAGEDVQAAAETYLKDALPQMGTYVVANKAVQSKRRQALKDGKMTRMELPGKRSFYLLDAEEWDEQAAREEGFVVGNMETIKNLEDKGLLEGEVINPSDYQHKEGTKAYRASVTAHARMFNMLSREEAKESYNLLQKLLNAQSTKDRGIRFTIRPGVVIRDTRANIHKNTGYAYEGDPNVTESLFIGAANVGGVVALTPISTLSDVLEDYIEAAVKDEVAENPTTSGVEYKALIRAITSQNKKNNQLLKFKDIDLLAKAYIASRGIDSKFQSELFSGMELDENTREMLNDFVTEVLGADVAEIINTQTAAAEKAEKEEKAEETPLRSNVKPGETGEESNSAESGESIFYQDGVKDRKEGMDSATAKQKAKDTRGLRGNKEATDYWRGYNSDGKSYSLQEFAAQEKDKAKAFLSGKKKFSDLIADYEQFAGEQQDLPELWDMASHGEAATYSQLSLELLRQRLADVVEEPGAFEELQETIEAAEGEGISKLTLDQKANMHLIVQAVAKLVGQGDAQRYLIGVIRRNPELIDQMSSREGFEQYMNSEPRHMSERRIQQAIRDTNIGFEYMRDTLRFFSNVFILPARKYILGANGNTKIIELNKHDQYDVWGDEISDHLDEQFKHYEAWKSNAEYKQIRIKKGEFDRAQWLSDNIGLPVGVWSVYREGYLAQIQAPLAKIMRQDVPPAVMKHLILDHLQNPVTLENGRTINSVFHQLGTKMNGEKYLSPMYMDIGGNMTSAARQTSHLISFMQEYAKKIGVPADQVMTVIDGYENEKTGKTAEATSPVEANRLIILQEMFRDTMLDSNGIPYYWQSLGRMGDKGHIYAVMAQKYDLAELQNLKTKYARGYERVVTDEGKEIAEEFLLSPEDFNDLVDQGKVFEANYAYNKAIINSTLHGNYSVYRTLENLVKRSSQIPTGGESFEGTWNVFTIKDVDKRFDGMALFTDRFGKAYASFMGPNSMRGADKATGIKAHVSTVDGNRELIKVNWVNIDELAGIPFYEDLKVWLDLYAESHKKPIDLIVFDSGAKLTTRPFMDFLERGSNGRFKFLAQPDADLGGHVSELDGRNFITSQWLNHSRYMHLRKVPRQMNTDHVNFSTSRRESELFAEIQEELLSALGAAMPSLSGNRVTALAQLTEATLGAGFPVTDISGNLNPEFTEELINIMQGEMEALKWSQKIDKQHYADMFRALILAGESEVDPRYAQLASAIKARFIEKQIRRELSGTVMQKVSEADTDLPEFRLVKEDGSESPSQNQAHRIALPWIIANVQGARTAAWGFKTKEEAIQEIRRDPRKYEDMFYVDDKGMPTDKIREYELFHDVDKKFGHGWIIPGEILFETRVPAENVHSHTPLRLYRSTNPDSVFNGSITPRAIQERKGEDFDGDKGFIHGITKGSNTKIDTLRNRIFRLKADNYTRKENYPEIRASVDVQKVFDKLALKYEAEAARTKRARKVYANTLEGELHAHSVNATAYDALSATAAGGRLWDYAQAMGFSLKERINGLVLYGSGANAIKLSFNKDSVKKLTQKQRIMRKLYYQTALVNLTVDDPSDPKMHILNLNEITTPIMQALVVLNDNLKTQEAIEKYMERIVTYFKSPVMLTYVEAQRDTQRVNWVRPDVQTKHGLRKMTNQEYLLNQIVKRHGAEEAEKIKKLFRLMQEARDYSGMLNMMYAAPRDVAKYISQNKAYESFIENRGSFIDTDSVMTNGKIHPHFAALDNASWYYSTHAFNESYLLSAPGKKLLQSMPFHLDNEEGYRKVERIAQRAIMVAALQFPKAISADKLITVLNKRIEDPQYQNRFTDMIMQAGDVREIENEAGNKEQIDSRIIQIIEKYRYSEIPLDVLEETRKDFDKLPHPLKQAFALYNYVKFGTSGSTFTGSYSKLFGNDFSKWLSDQTSFIHEKLTNGEMPLLNNNIFVQMFNNSIMNWEGNFLQNNQLDAVMSNMERPNVTDLNDAISSESHSLVEMHRAISARSPVMFSGARGLHKMYLQQLDHLMADQYNARIKREYLEIKTAARKSFNRDEKSTEADKKRGEDMLAAAISIIENEMKVLQGHEVVEMDLFEAWNIRKEQVAQAYPEYFHNTPASAEDLAEIDNARRNLFKFYPLKVQPGMTIAEAKQHLLYIRMAMLMRAKKWKTFPIKQPIYDTRPADQIAAEYDANRQDWMLTSEQVVNELREALNKARITMNTDMIGQKREWISYKANYVPHYYHIDDKKEDQTKEEVRLKELEKRENFSRTEKRYYKSYVEAAEVGNLMPATVNAAELYERWMNEAARTKFKETIWGLLLLGSNPAGIPAMLPIINAEMYSAGKQVLLPTQMLDQAAKLWASSHNLDYRQGMDPVAFLNAQKPNESDYERMDTGIASIPAVWVRKDHTRNVVKMLVDSKNDSSLWRLWERANAWTKFMAIGFPYMSYFHKAAILESAIAIKGIQGNPIFSPIAHYKQFKEFRQNLLDDPELAEWWIRKGLQARNTHVDYAQGVVNKDLELMRDKALAGGHTGIAKMIDRFIEIKKTWDNHLWQDFHSPLKIWLAEGLMNDQRQMAINRGYEFNENLVAREIAVKVDDALGGQQFQRNIWTTPKVQQTLNNLFFAYDWTISALGIAGIKNIPGMKNVLGTESPITNTIMYQKYWPAFAAIILFGIPNAIQMAIYALTRPFGDDDDEPFTFLNEADRASWIDITPLLRLTSPIPGIGYEGGKTGEERIYLRWGKQAYEVFEGWLQHPVETLGHKTSMTVKAAFEQVTGRSMGGWDLDFKNAGLMGVLEANGSFWKSRSGNIVQKFTPFLVQDIINGRPTAWFAKAKTGKSEWYATKQLTELYLGYTQKGKWDQLRGHQANVLALGSAIIDAAYQNGFDGMRAHERALSEVRKQLYIDFLKELKAEKYKAAEITAQKILAMNGTAWEIEQFIRKKLSS